jgi:hypothetical protein
MCKNISKFKKENVKKAILKGEQYVTHYSNKLIAAKKQLIDFDCKCKIKCATTLTFNQKKEIFDRYYALKSHSQQFLFLKPLVIPITYNKTKYQKMHYFIETKSENNQVLNN